MINLAIFNNLGQPNGILDLKKGFDKTLKNIPEFAEDCLAAYKNRTDDLSNKVRLNKIPILIFFQLYCKINREQLESA